MNRNDIIRTVIAVVLALVVLVVWQQYFGPKPASSPAPPPPTASPGATPSGAEVAPAAAPQLAATAAAPVASGPPVSGDPKFPPLTITTTRQELTLSPRGGRILSWKLREHERVPGDEKRGVVDLVSTESRALDRHPLVIVTGDATLDKTINEAPCVVEQDAPPADELQRAKLPPGTRRVTFRWADGAGLELEKKLYIPDDDRHLVRVAWSLKRGGQPLSGAALWWGPSIGQTDEGKPDRYSYRGFVQVATGRGVEQFKPDAKSGDIAWSELNAPRWLALDERYFAVALIPSRPSAAALRVVRLEGQELPGLALAVAAPELTIFAGPKSDQLLRRLDKDLGTDLSKLIRWGFLGFIAWPLYLALAFFNRLVGNWGVAIVLITVVIRVLFFPLTQKSMVGMRKTQEQMGKLQPKIHKIREKYKGKRDMDTRRRMNEEMMELYRREGVNPMASLTGCLPLLLQMPVLFAMYTVLSVATDLRGAPFFGWIHDLSARDPYYITPIVMGATQFVQQLMSMTKTEDPQQRSQQRMMLIMPLIFTWMFLSFPSGLVVYWLVNNLLGIAQQWLINRQAAAARGTS